MERIRQFLRRWKPLTELVLTLSVIIVAIFAAVIAWRSDATFEEEAGLLREAKTIVAQEDATFKQEAELLRDVKTLVEQENVTFKQGVAILETTKGLIGQTTELIKQTKELVERETIHEARDDFDKVLDEADRYCEGCSQCSPSYAINIPLDKAVRREQEVTPFLTAAEYNRLAMLGSAVWEFGMAEKYVRKAMDKKDKTPVDVFVSHLVLGHLNFVHLKDDPEHATLKDAKDHFTQAIAALPPNSGSDAIRTYVGRGYGIWAAHEAVLKHSEESDRLAKLAKASWSGLSDAHTFEVELSALLASASAGVMPQIACLFKSPVRLANCPPCRGVTAAKAAFEAPGVPTPAAAQVISPPGPPLAGTDATSYYNRGIIYVHTSEWDKAISDFNDAIRLDPKSGMAYYGRGFAYYKKGDQAKADEDFATAKELGYKPQ
ncbi:MAG: tetratricopeptide repeat protein [Thermoguttaceae bacterium]|jgi:tetratricopeptide (TPR) repeat protein